MSQQESFAEQQDVAKQCVHAEGNVRLDDVLRYYVESYAWVCRH